MKLSSDLKIDVVIPPEEWKRMDNCPVCRVLKRALLEGRPINPVEWEEAFSEAEKETDSV